MNQLLTRRWTIGIASTAAVVLLAACSSTTSSAPGTSVAPVVPVKQGGSIVVGAEQEPDCADWLSSCAGSIWGDYIMRFPTIPRAFVVRRKGSDWVPVASDVLAGEPTITDAAKPKITYRINPAAVWSDGKPITSEDFKYTALQIRDGKDILDKSSASKIASIDASDPKTAVITLKSRFGGWKTLFSDSYGILPSHLLAGKDRHALMKDGYSFSGGPWKIAQWKRGTSVTLVPNDRYWGQKPHLDRVTFQFTPDTAAAFQAFKSGQIDALFPTPQLDVLDQIKSGMTGANMQVDPRTGNLEALWMNNASFPFNEQPVRQAVAYSIDRAAIVKQLYGPLGVTNPAQSFLTPMVGSFGGTDFTKYGRNLNQVATLMTGDGWAKGPDGIWAKNGKPARFTIVSLAGNKRRELMEQILQSQLHQAGFQLDIKNTTSANLFSKVAPTGDFQLGLWTLIDYFPDPELSGSFSSKAIPTEANDRSGFNFSRADVTGLDPLLDKVDGELDQSARQNAAVAADRIIADNVPALPISIVPDVLLWSKKLGGPISINAAEGPWWNLADWGLAR